MKDRKRANSPWILFLALARKGGPWSVVLGWTCYSYLERVLLSRVGSRPIISINKPLLKVL